MLSSVELEYVKALINTYYAKGYKNYLCHTITDNNNDYDFVIYFSKFEISAISDNYFEIQSAVKLSVDSSVKSQYNNNSNDNVEKFSGFLSVDTAEFIYTNAVSTSDLTVMCLNPDLSIEYKKDFSFSYVSILICILLLYIFIRDLFGLGGR